MIERSITLYQSDSEGGCVFTALWLLSAHLSFVLGYAW